MNAKLALLFLGVSSATLIDEAGLQKRDLPGPYYSKPSQVAPSGTVQSAPVDPEEAWIFVEKEYQVFSPKAGSGGKLSTEESDSEFSLYAVAQDHVTFHTQRLGILMQTLAEKADSFRSMGKEDEAKEIIDTLTKSTIMMNEGIFSIAAPQCSWFAQVASTYEFVNEQFSAARSAWGESPTKFPEPTCNTRLALVYEQSSMLSGSALSSALDEVNSYHGSPAKSRASEVSLSALSALSSLSSSRSASRSSRSEHESSSDAAVDIAPGMVSSFAAMLLALL